MVQLFGLLLFGVMFVFSLFKIWEKSKLIRVNQIILIEYRTLTTFLLKSYSNTVFKDRDIVMKIIARVISLERDAGNTIAADNLERIVAEIK